MIRFPHRSGFVFDQLPAILWAAVIFVASSIPNVTLPDIEFLASDKVVHVVIYFILCALATRALAHQMKSPFLSRWSLLCGMFLTVLYGALDEVHQSFVPNRDASLGDLAADTMGVLLYLGYVLWKRHRVAPGSSMPPHQRQKS